MSPPLQAKLLRVLQSREFERVGDAQTIKRGRSCHRRHERGSRNASSPQGDVPRRPLLPPQRDSDPPAAASRAGAKTSRFSLSTSSSAAARNRRRHARRATVSQDAHAAADVVSVAGQRSTARERDRARVRAHLPGARRSTCATCRPISSGRPTDRSPPRWRFPTPESTSSRTWHGIEHALIRRVARTDPAATSGRRQSF